ncbi:MAG: hypothetical protein AB8H86_09520 [Polyangiales bacterium]
MKRTLALALLALVLLRSGPASAQAQEAAEPGPVAETGPDASDGEPEDAVVSGEGVPAGDPLAAPDEDASVPSEDTSDEYVLGESTLHLDMPTSPMSMESLQGSDGSTDATVVMHHDLELALRLPTYDFDGVSFISASRSLITAVLETYCAAGLLFPGDDGYDVGEVLLGAGCLLGATTLYIMGIRKLMHPSEERRAIERLARFEALRNGEGVSDEDVAMFENELHSAARRDRRRRIIEIIFGGLNIVATATIAGLTARGRIDSTVGTSIATGTGALGVLSLSSIFVRSPSERAWSGYEAR